MRLLSEVFYATFLNAYVVGLRAHKERLNAQGKASCSLTNDALKLAEEAQSDGIFAADMALEGKVEVASTLCDEAFQNMVKRFALPVHDVLS